MVVQIGHPQPRAVHQHSRRTIQLPRVEPLDSGVVEGANTCILAAQGQYLQEEVRFRRKDGSFFDGILFMRVTQHPDL